MRYPPGIGSETGRNSGYREPQSLNLDDLLLKNPGFGMSMRNSPRQQMDYPTTMIFDQNDVTDYTSERNSRTGKLH